MWPGLLLRTFTELIRRANRTSVYRTEDERYIEILKVLLFTFYYYYWPELYLRVIWGESGQPAAAASLLVGTSHRLLLSWGLFLQFNGTVNFSQAFVRTPRNGMAICVLRGNIAWCAWRIWWLGICGEGEWNCIKINTLQMVLFCVAVSGYPPNYLMRSLWDIHWFHFPNALISGMSVDSPLQWICAQRVCFCMWLKPVQRDRERYRERDSKCCTFVVGIWGSFMWVDIPG